MFGNVEVLQLMLVVEEQTYIGSGRICFEGCCRRPTFVLLYGSRGDINGSPVVVDWWNLVEGDVDFELKSVVEIILHHLATASAVYRDENGPGYLTGARGSARLRLDSA
ncbi:hypothetical protein PIB30_036979 [Stylosanthes scabra]|uniref:Uncharacterized protein n=1 Tax=Stylosanthes scabra TaxID=79078 RepID=A0ABU6YBY8_9FABA|nr:hypothetical protein [Stylosanthes scabra]